MRSVDDKTADQPRLWQCDHPALLLQVELLDRRQGPQLNPVADSIGRQRVAGLVGVDNAGGGRVECSQHRGGQGRFGGLDLGSAPAFDPWNLTNPRVVEQGVQHRELLGLLGDGQLTDPANPKPQFDRQRVPELVAGPFELAFEGPQAGMVAAVQDAAVGFGGAKAHLGLLLAQHDAQPIAAQLTGQRTANNSTADDEDVAAHQLPLSPERLTSPSILADPTGRHNGQIASFASRPFRQQTLSPAPRTGQDCSPKRPSML